MQNGKQSPHFGQTEGTLNSGGFLPCHFVSYEPGNDARFSKHPPAARRYLTGPTFP